VRVVLLGPPGVGKGTQGRRLAAERGWALISTGEILRDAVARRTPVGLEAARRMDRGLLVPDDVMIELVRGRLGRPDAAHGFVLDGFPRTVPQADALERMLGERGESLSVVSCLAMPESRLVRRLTARRECPVCQRAYNLDTAPPRDRRHCDDHPGVELVQRADDAEETVRRRLEVYHEQTAPLVEYYRKRGLLMEVGADGTPDEVYRRLQGVLESGAGAPAPKSHPVE
jgi:adenylate kinase